MLGSAESENLSDARIKAFENVKYQITTSINQSLRAVSVLSTREHYHHKIEFEESYQRTLTSIADNLVDLQGISTSKIADIYWEQHRTKSNSKYTYFILYPFDQQQLEGYIREHLKQLESRLRRLDEIVMKQASGYTHLEKIMEDLNRVQIIQEELPGNYKSRSQAASQYLKSILDEIVLVILDYSESEFSYKLEYNGRLITTNLTPVISSSNAITKIMHIGDSIISIDYKLTEKPLNTNNTSFEIRYQMNDVPMSKLLFLDLSELIVDFKLDGTVNALSKTWDFWEGRRTAIISIPIAIQSSCPFKIIKAEFYLQKCYDWWVLNKEYKSFPALVAVPQPIEMIKNPGIYELHFQANYPIRYSYSYSSKNQCGLLVHLRILYQKNNHNEVLSKEFQNIKYLSNW
jgi:hypothetical protein